MKSKFIFIMLFILTITDMSHAHMEGSYDEAKLIKEARAVVSAVVVSQDKSGSRCSSTTSVKFKLLGALKGDVFDQTELNFEWSMYFPRKKNWFWQQDCDHVIYLVPPIAKNLQTGDQVWLSVEKKSVQSDWRVTGTWDLDRADYLKTLIRQSYASIYQSLSDKDKAAYEAVAMASGFESAAVGVAGSMPLSVSSLRALIRHPLSEEIFLSLLHEATLPGQLYALCGLFVIKSDEATILSQPYENRDTKIAVTEGCMTDLLTVKDLFGKNNNASMLEGGSFGEICGGLVR